MADPGYVSPKDLLENEDYEQCEVDDGWNNIGACSYVVYKHKATETFWRASFDVRLDDSDWDVPTRWTEVVPKTITKVVYHERSD